MTDDSRESAARQREPARRALVEAVAASERLPDVHRRASMLLGDDAAAPVREQIGARMRVTEERMIEVGKLMKDADRSAAAARQSAPTSNGETR